jgi:hypothetical protein
VRLGERGADADADGLDAVTVEIELRHVLAEGLRQAVVAVGALAHPGVDLLVLPVEADHVVRAREHDALRTMATGGLVDVEHAADVAFEHFLERPLHRDAAQVDDGVAALDQRVDGGLVGKIADHDLLVRAGRRSHRRDVREPDHVGERCETLAQFLAEAASRAGQQQARQFARVDGGGGRIAHRCLVSR